MSLTQVSIVTSFGSTTHIKHCFPLIALDVLTTTNSLLIKRDMLEFIFRFRGSVSSNIKWYERYLSRVLTSYRRSPLPYSALSTRVHGVFFHIKFITTSLFFAFKFPSFFWISSVFCVKRTMIET